MENSDQRTALRSLRVEGFRSIKSVVLEDIPDLAVFYGKNGSGKSNLLKAVELGCRAVGYALSQTLNANWPGNSPSLRPEDYFRPEGAYVGIAQTWKLGRATLQRLKVPFGIESMDFNFAARQWNQTTRPQVHATLGPLIGNVHWWKNVGDPSELLAFPQFAELRERLTRDPALRNSLEVQQIHDVWSAFERRLVSEFLGGWAVSVGSPYRLPNGDLETRLHTRMMDDAADAGAAILRLEELLREATLFQGLNRPRLRPVLNSRVHITTPHAGELPLSSIGTGEQQVILLLAQRILDNCPVVQIEEPEAHLHTSLMRPFAELLRQAVRPTSGPPAIEQLMIATHHHLFALDEEFFEVRLEDGQTVVERKKRAQAATHFYEPGALWDALQSLLANGMKADSVIFRTEDGQPITAQQVVDSERGDRRLFNDWVTKATERIVLSMKGAAGAGQ